ncbi:MAG: OmpA family protein, partial [Bacteroidota bacterium]|nr:OmpA family protein [Bacteroidota bacterium]
ITDNLPKELSYLSTAVTYYRNGQAVLHLAGGDFDTLTRVLTWKYDSLGIGDSLLMVLNAGVRSDLAPGEYSYTNVATLTWPQGSSQSDQDSASNAGVHTVVSYLKITKQAIRKVLEIGDIATYVVKVTNISTTSYARRISVVDRIPFGFGYLGGSSFGDSAKIADPTGKKQLTWNLTDSLPPQSTVQLVYRLAVGAGANEGNGINTAQAFGMTPLGMPVQSAPVNEQVEVHLGVFTTHGLVIGKVFYDDNHNAYQDSGEAGVKGVELMLENGTRVVTGDDGKYSIPDLEPGDHVIKVRTFTIPKNSALITGHDEFAGDPGSRFVHLTESGIARVDFYLKHLVPPAPDTIQLRQTIAKAGVITIQRIADPRNVVFIEDARIAPMKLTGLQFEVGKAKLRPEAYPTLKQLAGILHDYPHLSVLIVGHTDAMHIHTKEFPSNMELSYARANAAKYYLVLNEQIDPSRIRTQGFGKTRPIATNATVEGRALNRRVEFYFGNETEPPKLSSTRVVFRITINYEGTVPLQKLEVHDVLDTTFHYVVGSAQLGDTTIATRVDGQNLYWTIDSIGTRLNTMIVYQAVVNQPAQERLVIARSYTSATCFAGDSIGMQTDSLKTTNEIAVAERGKAVNYVMSGVLFDVAKATLRQTASSALEISAEVMKADPRSTAVVEGHTDSNPIHTFEFPSNLELSQARANAIVDALVNQYGISRDRFRAIGYGALRPVASNATEDGRQRNRRVEIQIFRKDFVDSEIPPGLVDSSALAHRRFIPKAGIHPFDSSAIGYVGDEFMFKLEVHKKITTKTLTTTLIDTLPAGIEMLPNTLTAMRGIDSISMNGNVITAMCSPNDSLSVLTFLTEVTREMTAVSTKGNQFTIVRHERTGKIVRDSVSPMLMEIRRVKEKNGSELAKAIGAKN